MRDHGVGVYGTLYTFKPNSTAGLTINQVLNLIEGSS